MRGRLKDILKARQRNMLTAPLACSICLFLDDDTLIEDAVTILNGHAVCTDHMYLVRDNLFMNRVAFAKGEKH